MMMIRFVTLFTIVTLFFSGAQSAQKDVIYVIDIKGVIGPATSDYFHRSLEKAVKNDAQLVVIRIDTPGGLGTAMREIIQDILKSPVPVSVYVSPSGARAASAGTYILYASHISAMAPGTNLGAATPVQIGGGGGIIPTPQKTENGKGKTEETKKPYPTLKEKSINDSIAYIRSLAQLRKRNVEWAEKAIREAASISSEEALKLKVIDIIAGDTNNLLIKINGRSVKVKDKVITLDTTNTKLIFLKPDWRFQFLGVITDPNVAYMLMLIGFYGLILEFYSPGLVGPGIIGSICLLLAFYALNVLPVNYAALGLLLLGIVFMVLEAYSPSFGILGLGGAVAFIVGSIMLIDTDADGFSISTSLIASLGVLLTGVFLFTVIVLGTARRSPAVAGLDNMVGCLGKVIDWHDGQGRIQVHGTTWQAKGDETLVPGSHVRVEKMNGLVLIVKSVS